MSYYGTYMRLGLHVIASNLDVIRAARAKIAPHHRTGRDKREARREFYRAMLENHAEALALYHDVARGI